MLERRRQPRNKVYYGGLVAFNARNSTIACVVRNFSMVGAKIELEGTALVPDQVDFEIGRKSLSCPARVIWRNRNEAGLVFADTDAASGVVSLDWARKLQASERANRHLQARIEQLRSEY